MPRTCPGCQNEYQDDVEVCPADGTDLAAEHDDPLLGTSIGSYKVVKLLGRGGMGSVYLAEHPVIGSRVAIKFLHPQYSNDKKIVDRFFNEARAVNVIGHDNILKILDLNVTEDGRHYFVMELLTGKSLQSLVEQGKPVPLEVAGPILLQFCEALQAAHDRKIFHRDVKPDNVYLVAHKGRKNFVKVVDFGIAKLTDKGAGAASNGTTQTGMVMGTPAYMSPEQASGETGKIDGRSDIYSTGVMMFQLATGKLPFPGESFGEVLIGHLQLQPPAPRALQADVPEAYEAVILKALAKKQEERQQSMRELYEEILSCMEALGITAELPIADDEDLSHSQRSFNRGPLTPMRTTPRPQENKAPRFHGAEVQPRPKTAPRRSGQTLATRMQPQETRPEGLPAPKRPARWKLPAIVVGSVLVIVVAGVAAWEISANSDERLESAARHAAAHARDVLRKRPPDPEAEAPPILLSVISIPEKAEVEATWGEHGRKKGPAPLDFRVPRNTKVSFLFTLRGYSSYRADVIADESQVVKAVMQRGIVQRVQRAAAQSADGGSAREATGDDIIDVGDDIFGAAGQLPDTGPGGAASSARRP